jgi:hypothetical protein
LAYTFEIYVIARDEDAVKLFKENNPCITSAKFCVNPSSIFKVISEILFSDADYAIICHDDVTYPSSFNSIINDLVSKLNTDWPKWGIAGNSGISVVQNVCDNRIVKYAIEDGELPSSIGHILPAETIDGNTILLNCRSLRNAKISIPQYDGMHEYDTILSIATQYHGLSVLICPELACFHLNISYPTTSVPIQYSDAFLSFLSSKITNRKLKTVRENFSIPKKNSSEQRYDLRRLAAVNASKGRTAKLGIITRSQFRSISLLNRTIESVKEFRDAAISNIQITHYIATDVSKIIEFPGSEDVTILHYPDVKREDSRNILIQRAVNDSNDDFILLLDDDDWLFPNEALLVSAALVSTPRTGSLVVESQLFEELFDSESGELLSRNENPTHVFRSDDWQQNFSGINHIPSCGVFYSRELVTEVPDASFNSVKYYEDFAISSFVMLNPRAAFFNIPVLTAGISIRSHPDEVVKNTVTEKDRSKWNQSLAEFSYLYADQKQNNIVRGIGGALAINIQQIEYNSKQSRHSTQSYSLSRSDRAALVISRTAKGAFYFSVKPHLYASNIQRFITETKNKGLRGLVREVADTN